MNTYAIYEITTGEILRFYFGNNPSVQIEYGENYIQCEPTASQETHWVNNETLAQYTDEQAKLKRKNWFVGESWSNQTMDWQIDDIDLLRAEVANELRIKRNELLAQSDYTQMPDVPLSNKDLWDNYRQQLRDLPETHANITSLDEVTWPTPPQ